MVGMKVWGLEGGENDPRDDVKFRFDFFDCQQSCKFQPITDNPVMRPSLRLLAIPTAVGSTNGLKPAPLALLPPIPLYRRLLRAHRKHLDRQMRLLGDEYIKGEFRSHRNVENPMHIVSFTLCYCWQPL